MPKPLITEIRSLSNVASAASNPITVEEKKAQEFEMFRTDASMTIIAAMSTFVTTLAFKVCDMVELSQKSEWREKYGILKDYTKEPNTLSAVATIRRAVQRHTLALQSLIDTLSRFSYAITPRDGSAVDAGEDFMSRIDFSDEEFNAGYESIRRQITELFRGYKCSDPKMLYPLLNAIYMAGRYEVMARYIASFAQGFRKGEPFANLLRLHVLDPLMLLAHRLNLSDRHGHPFYFIFSDDERANYQAIRQKKSFQIKHRDNPHVVVDVRAICMADSLTRLAWELETHMMELRTIDRLITAAEGHDPEYRNDYKMKRLQSCASTYEQAMVNQAIILKKWKDIPMRMRNYLDSINTRKAIDTRRRPKPVVCFHLVPVRDKNGDVVRQADGTPDFHADFVGIWNSSYEAQNEWGTRWQDIRKSVTLKAVNDGRNNVWLSLDDYMSMLYNQLDNVHPEVAMEFRRIIPELNVRTTHEIASETSCPQGSFSQAAS